MIPHTLAPASSAATLRPEPTVAAPRRAGDDARRPSAVDTVDFSEQARALATGVGEGEAVRQDLVERVRSEIAAGTYETPEKYLVALSRALGDADSTL